MSDKLMIKSNIEIPVNSKKVGFITSNSKVEMHRIDYISLNKDIATTFYNMILNNIENLQNMKISNIKIDYINDCTITIEFEQQIQFWTD